MSTKKRMAAAAHLGKVSAVATEQQRFMVRVYNWMGAGLATSGVVSMLTASSDTMVELIFGNPIVFYGIFIAEIVMVFWLAGYIHKMSARTAQGVFLGYSVINGVTLSSIFLTYSASLIVSTFFITAGTFGAMSIYGYTTKRDITSWGSFFLMGLFAIIIASIVNLFLKSPMIDFVVSCVGVFVFVGLTAYDTQEIKKMNILGNEGSDEDTKEAISGALRLYLDFINLFLQLLRILSIFRE